MRTTQLFPILLLAACGTGAPTGESTEALKPTKTYTLPGVSFLLTTVLTDLYVQFDQTDDPTHGGNLVARGLSCVPASAATKASCRAGCPDLGDVNLIKACNVKCSNLQDCTPNVCLTRPTSSYAQFGSAFKAAFNKPCNAVGDACPACTVGVNTSAIEDVDLTTYIPDPIFRTTIVDPLSCRLNTFGIDLRGRPGFNFTDWVDIQTGDPMHITVKAFASDPTVRCTNGISPTLRSPTFDFYLHAGVVNHHPTLGLVSKFSSHVDYLLDWAYSLDSTVNDKITDTVNGVMGRNQAMIDQQLEKLILAGIKSTNNGDEVDDFLSVQFVNDSLVVTYTPKCVDGSCSCTPDCGGKQCGIDAHCGVSCGACKYGTCEPNAGVCQCTPTASCTGHCGTVNDGCGNMLHCPSCVCVPSCIGKRCGQTNGCGGTCSGPCAKVGYYCSDDGDGFKYCSRGN